MNKYLLIIIIAISFKTHAQLKENCIYVDQSILIINCGEEDRNKLSEAVYKLGRLKPKVIVLDFIFLDKRPAHSIFLKQLTGDTPVVLSMGDKNDSAYFSIENCYNGPRSIAGNKVNNVEFLSPIVKHN